MVIIPKYYNKTNTHELIFLLAQNTFYIIFIQLKHKPKLWKGTYNIFYILYALLILKDIIKLYYMIFNT
jgi:hypothetical protein